MSNLITTSDDLDVVAKNDPQLLVNDDRTSQSTNQQSKHRYLPTNTMLFCIISVGVLGAVSAIINREK